MITYSALLAAFAGGRRTSILQRPPQKPCLNPPALSKAQVPRPQTTLDHVHKELADRRRPAREGSWTAERCHRSSRYPPSLPGASCCKPAPSLGSLRIPDSARTSQAMRRGRPGSRRQRTSTEKATASRLQDLREKCGDSVMVLCRSRQAYLPWSSSAH